MSHKPGHGNHVNFTKEKIMIRYQTIAVLIAAATIFGNVAAQNRDPAMAKKPPQQVTTTTQQAAEAQKRQATTGTTNENAAKVLKDIEKQEGSTAKPAEKKK